FAEAATAKDVQQANLPVVTPASLIQAASAADQVQAQTAATQAQQGQVSQQPRADPGLAGEGKDAVGSYVRRN
ncbi:MAG: hypothetical protein ACK55Z_30445, partial [bacterium]